MDFFTMVIIVHTAFAVDDQDTDERIIVTPDLPQSSTTFFSWDPYSSNSNAQDHFTEPLMTPPLDYSSSTSAHTPTLNSTFPDASTHTGPEEISLSFAPLFCLLPRVTTEENAKSLPISMRSILCSISIIKFFSFDPSAIIRKYQERRINFERAGAKSLRPKDMRIIYKMELLCKEVRCQAITTHDLQLELAQMRQIMFNNTSNPPHTIIQSDYIVLWANLDICYTMNYILSAFCTGFDEVAFVTLLKQLTVFTDRNGKYVSIIKAIWDEIFHHPSTMNAVLYDITRNVASYSLRSLAVYDHNTSTMMRLLDESMLSKQQITLATYECVIRRLSKLRTPKRLLTPKEIGAIYRVWAKSTALIKSVHPKTRQAWKDFMLQTCWDLRLPSLTQRVKTFYGNNCTVGRARKRKKKRVK